MDSRPRSGSVQRAAVDQLPVGWPRRHRPDYVLIIITMVLLTIGLVVIYSISPALSLTNNVSQNY